MTSLFAESHNMVAILEKSDAAEGSEQIINFLSGSYINHALTVNPHVYISCIKQFWNTAVDEGIELVIAQEKDAEVLSMQEDDTEVQEAVEVVTTAKLMTEVVTAAATQLAAANPEEELPSDTLAETSKVKDKGKGILIEAPKSMKKKDQIEMDAEYARKLQEEINKEHEESYKNIDWNAALDHVQSKEPQYIKRYHGMKKKPQTESKVRKNMILYLKNTEGYKMDFFKGMKYDEILPIFQAKFDANIRFLFKSRDETEAEDEEIIKSINETPAQKAAKRRKLHEQAKEDEDLKKQLEIVDDKDDDVFIEATPIGRKVAVVDYEIVMINNKPRYKIIKADGTHHLYISFITLLKNFNREDLDDLWRIIKDRFSTSKPTNFSDDYLLSTLKTMFEKTDGQDAIWRNQQSVYGQALVKIEKRYPLSKFTLKRLVNVVRLKVEEKSEMSLELLRFTRQQLQEYQQGELRAIVVSSSSDQIEMDAKYARKLQEEINNEHEESYKNIDWNAALDHVQFKEPHEEAQEADDLRKRLEIVQDEDDDVFVEATPLAQKVPVVDYQIVVIDNKPKYKIIIADDTHQFYISFTTLLKNFDKEDLETLWKIVRDRFSTSKPTNFSDEYILLTLKTMFEEPYGQDAIWRNQKSVHGLALVKRWKLLTSCGVHVITLSTVQLFLLVERRYPLSRFTLEQLVNVSNVDAARLKLKLFKDAAAIAHAKLSLLGKKVEAIPKSAWTEKDQIGNFLKERRLMRIMRSMEKFVGGRLYEGDYRMLQRTI
nr:hypothetical protein [Tanacetum cinerariifolium]